MSEAALHGPTPDAVLAQLRASLERNGALQRIRVSGSDPVP